MNAAHGICDDCDRLVEIVPAGLRRVTAGLPSSQTGQREWLPLPHPTVEGGDEPCDGGERIRKRDGAS